MSDFLVQVAVRRIPFIVFVASDVSNSVRRLFWVELVAESFIDILSVFILILSLRLCETMLPQEKEKKQSSISLA